MLPINLEFEESFFEEEEQCGFLVDKNRKELWAVELDLLNEFDKVCRKHNLTYYLDGGTLLGAVRHKGFIPWDDDIDVNMMREDYDKLLEVAPKEFKGRYFFQHHFTEPGYIKGFAKLRNSETAAFKIADLEEGKDEFNQGIFIDIFPLDYLPEKDGKIDRVELKKQSQKLFDYRQQLHKLTRTSHKRRIKRWLSSIRKIFANLVMEKPVEIFKKRESIAKGNPKGNFVDELTFLSFEKLRLLEKAWYNEIEYVEFANLKAPIPKCYHEILTHYYGADYMTPKQVGTLHGELLYDAHHSYKELFAKK